MAFYEKTIAKQDLPTNEIKNIDNTISYKQ